MKPLLFTVIAICFIAMGTTAEHKKSIDSTPVERLDVNRYMGMWYEIARFDHPFERGMSRVTAEYGLMPDDKIKVTNRGEKKGRHREITGTAWRADDSGRGVLKVRFFVFPSKYIVMELSPDYRYALVGSSSPKYLWVLSRDSTMKIDELNALLRKAEKRGYDVEDLIFVAQ